MALLILVEDNIELGSALAREARRLGHDARHVPTGRTALEALETFAAELAVVDLMLPDMRGMELLRLLKERGVPTVAMTGVYKGDRFRAEAVDVHGARAFIEKPFDMAALFASVSEVVGTPTAPLPELTEPAPAPSPPRRVTPGSAELGTATREPRVETEPAPAGPPPPPAWLSSGDTQQHSVAACLTACFVSRLTGVLELRKENAVKLVYFVKGKIASAQSNMAAERFARFAVTQGAVTEEQLTSVAKPDVRVGPALVERRLMTRERRAALVEAQIKAIVAQSLTWTTGGYRFTADRTNKSADVSLGLFPGAVIFEGVLKTATLLTLRQKLPAERVLFPVAEPPYDLHALKLSIEHARLLIACDGTKTIADLIQLSDATERDTLAALAGFEAIGLVQERPTAPRSSRVTFGI